MFNDETKRLGTVTRRRFLAVMAGVAASAALAACGGNATDTPKAGANPTTAAGAPTTASGAPTTTGQPTKAAATTGKAGNKEFHSAWPYEVPPTGNFNMIQSIAHTIMQPPNIYADLILLPFAMYYWQSGDWLKLDGDGLEVRQWRHLQHLPAEGREVERRQGLHREGRPEHLLVYAHSLAVRLEVRGQG